MFFQSLHCCVHRRLCFPHFSLLFHIETTAWTACNVQSAAKIQALLQRFSLESPIDEWRRRSGAVVSAPPSPRGINSKERTRLYSLYLQPSRSLWSTSIGTVIRGGPGLILTTTTTMGIKWKRRRRRAEMMIVKMIILIGHDYNNYDNEDRRSVWLP